MYARMIDFTGFYMLWAFKAFCHTLFIFMSYLIVQFNQIQTVLQGVILAATHT